MPDGTTERIVIVDDEEVILTLLKRVLNAPGRIVEVFPSASVALERMRTQPPDVVVTDMHMPEVSGEEFIGNIRREFGERIGIVVITAFPTLVSDSDDVARGIGAYLRKPFTDLDLLRSTVSQVIENRRRKSHRRGISEYRKNLAAAMVSLRHQRADLSRAAAVLDGIEDGIIVTNRSGRLALLNAAASRLLQRSSYESLGRPLRTLRTEQALKLELLRCAGDEGNSASSPQIQLGDGRILSLTASPLVNAEGKQVGKFFVLRDITAEVRMREIKRQYLTVVSHELRTPLTTLRNFASLLSPSEVALKGNQQERIRAGIVEQTLRLEHQIDKLLLLARLEQNEVPEDAELIDLLVEASAAVEACRCEARLKGVDFTLTRPRHPIWGYANPEDFRKAVYEITENAVKFTPTGGAVHLSAESAGREALVRVRDTGIGIDPRYHRAIFDEFRQLEPPLTRTYQGAGLGLALARRIVEAWRGRIEVRSAVGAGATFTLRIPTAPTEEQPGIGFPHLSEVTLSGVR